MLNKSNPLVKLHYYDNLERDYFLGLKVYGYGCQKILPNQNYPPRRHPKRFLFNHKLFRCLDIYTIVYITEGAGNLIIDDNQFKIKKGDFIVIKPGLNHSYYPCKETGWKEYFAYFDGDIIDNMILNSFIDLLVPVMSIGLNNEVVSLFNSMFALQQVDECVSYNRVSGIIMHILGLLIYENERVKHRDSNYDEIIEDAKIIMQQYVFGHIKPANIALELKVPYHSFRKKFKLITGCSPADYMMKLKIQKAKKLLVETNMFIKNVAFQLSFSSLETFVVAFRKQTGYSPTQYRKSFR